MGPKQFHEEAGHGKCWRCRWRWQWRG